MSSRYLILSYKPESIDWLVVPENAPCGCWLRGLGADVRFGGYTRRPMPRVSCQAAATNLLVGVGLGAGNYSGSRIWLFCGATSSADIQGAFLGLEFLLNIPDWLLGRLIEMDVISAG